MVSNHTLTREELEAYMNRCIGIARNNTQEGIWYPHVGALVLTPEREIIGTGVKGYLDRTKLVVHAERVALYQAKDRSKGSYLFTTLEPCVGGRNTFQSCSRMIRESGISLVVFGAHDLTPKGYGGSDYLRSNGIEVVHLDQFSGEIEKDLMKGKIQVKKILGY